MKTSCTFLRTLILSLTVTAPFCAVSAQQTDAEHRQVVGVSGMQLTLDGLPWLPQGVMIRAFVSTPAFLANPANEETSTAPAAYGSAAQVAALREYGADTLRFPVSQYYLAAAQNPPSAPTAYAQSVVNAIKTARANGFVVIIQMQDEQPAGDPDYAEHKLPIAATTSAWAFLNASF